MTNPRARCNEIFSETLATETIVYDKASHRAHSLNKTVGLVWKSADGQTSVDEMAEILRRELEIPADRGIVLLALEELASAGLLEKPIEVAVGGEVPSRRQVAKRLALAGASAALIPFVASVLAPTPAMASSAAPISQKTAQADLVKADVEAYSDPFFYVNPTAMNDLKAGSTAYAQGQYTTEIADLDGTLKALGLPPL